MSALKPSSPRRDSLPGRMATAQSSDGDDGSDPVTAAKGGLTCHWWRRRLAGLLAQRTGMRTENLAVVLVETERGDWSFGRGQASYLELPRDAWR